MALYDLLSLNQNGAALGKSGIAKFANESATGVRDGDIKQEAGLAKTLIPFNGSTQEINVVKDYPWTLSNKDDEIPYIRLKEYKCVDSSIKKQLGFYFQLTKDRGAGALGLIGDLIGNVAGAAGAAKTYENTLDVYTDIWPKDNPTGFSYRFPYFQKTGFELTSPAWTSIGSMGDSMKQIAQGIAQFKGTEQAEKYAKSFGKNLDLAEAASDASLNTQYPSVGVNDRPKMFSNHNDRSITINFVLYNIINETDWEKNRDLIYLLMSQNLFNKRDLTTGVPPVFYDVYIPGQYYSYASCITNVKVDYLGNQRLLYDSWIVPDAYDVSLTLTELVKPSKNQFEAVQSGAAADYVNTSRNVGSSDAAVAGAVAGVTGVIAAQVIQDKAKELFTSGSQAGTPGNNQPPKGTGATPQKQQKQQTLPKPK